MKSSIGPLVNEGVRKLGRDMRTSFKVHTSRAAAGWLVRSFNLDRETRLAVHPVDAIWPLVNALSIQHFGDDCF